MPCADKYFLGLSYATAIMLCTIYPVEWGVMSKRRVLNREFGIASYDPLQGYACKSNSDPHSQEYVGHAQSRIQHTGQDRPVWHNKGVKGFVYMGPLPVKLDHVQLSIITADN